MAEFPILDLTFQDHAEKVTYRSPKCRGILGLFFGHSFKTFDYFLTHCKRCGIEQGTIIKVREK